MRIISITDESTSSQIMDDLDDEEVDGMSANSGQSVPNLLC